MVGFHAICIIIGIMPTSVAQRLTSVEKQLAALTRKMNGPKDWRNAVGTLRDTKLAREADELGRRYRAGQKRP
jgi:hypothetical protein